LIGRGAPAASGAMAEFQMTAGDFQRITERVESTFGIVLGNNKRQMVYSRLARRLRALGLPTVSAYLDFLDRPEGAAEQEKFTNAFTTNLTAFFREAHHFTHFEQEVLAGTLADARRRLRIWSAGCSTGEEPYSLAMILHDRAAMLSACDRRILATDLDTDVLAKAQAGRFALERLRGLPNRFRGPSFLTASDDEIAVTEEVRRLVTFRPLNLIESWPMRGPFDAIFCRNVLIYFSAEAKARLIDRMADILRPGGILYLGHSESILGAHPKLEAVGNTIYRRAGR